jgi:3-phenylpropionate/trans-cinnamate dioxygenase ferredoxin reductase subunit
MEPIKTIVIVGAGQAGHWAAHTLRKQGYDGRIMLIGSESHPPYERPPLSKQILKGEAEPPAAWLTTPEKLIELTVDFLPGRTIVALDRHGRQVELQDGARIAYDRLLLATGSRPRRLNLPGETDAPAFYLRDIADALALRERLAAGRRLIVIGGGLIGLEVAAAAVARGCAVTVIEVADRLMARVVGPEISAHFAQLHQARGTEILTGRIPERIEASEDRCRVVCRDGGSCGGDLAVIGCGVIPNAELAAAAGLKVENGLWVDEFCRTDDPKSGPGDVTNHLNPVLGRRLRLETWQNAQNQAIAAARNMAGDPQPYAEIPWGWSDQLGANLQVLGVPTSFDQAVTRGHPASGSFTVFYVDGEKIAGVNASTRRRISPSRRLMASDVPGGTRRSRAGCAHCWRGAPRAHSAASFAIAVAAAGPNIFIDRLASL